MLGKLVLTAALAGLAALGPAGALAAEGGQADIAAVNIQLVMNEIPQAKAVNAVLQQEFGPRQEELHKIEEEGRKLESEIGSLTGQAQVDAQRRLASLRSDFQLKGQALQEDQRKRVQEENVKLARLVQTAIDAVARERGLLMVLRGEAVAYATKAADISDEVISRVSSMNDSTETQDKK